MARAVIKNADDKVQISIDPSKSCTKHEEWNFMFAWCLAKDQTSYTYNLNVTYQVACCFVVTYLQYEVEKEYTCCDIQKVMPQPIKSFQNLLFPALYIFNDLRQEKNTTVLIWAKHITYAWKNWEGIDKEIIWLLQWCTSGHLEKEIPPGNLEFHFLKELSVNCPHEPRTTYVYVISVFFRNFFGSHLWAPHH